MSEQLMRLIGQYVDWNAEFDRACSSGYDEKPAAKECVRLRDEILAHVTEIERAARAAEFKAIKTKLSDLLQQNYSRLLTTAMKDAARYRWLREHAKERPVRPETLGSDFPDTRTHWVLPTLIAYGPAGGPTRTLDEAIDVALAARNGQ